jgi:hypothetical protein
MACSWPSTRNTRRWDSPPASRRCALRQCWGTTVGPPPFGIDWRGPGGDRTVSPIHIKLTDSREAPVALCGNHKRRNFTQTKRDETLKAIGVTIEHYLDAWEAADEAEADAQKPTAEALRKRIQPLHERKGRDEGLKEAMEGSGERQGSLTDPDSCAMPKSPKVDVGDNAQGAVDNKPKLLIIQEVTNSENIDYNGTSHFWLCLCQNYRIIRQASNGSQALTPRSCA